VRESEKSEREKVKRKCFDFSVWKILIQLGNDGAGQGQCP